ncbi:efflux RND transporter periplasmic adaptor subunit [Hydrogenophaga atypica]|uniref:Efflux RND transporter periplasmic adaptor subunit n=1 Tax=Hydrogenophaga atypica TaxID=249409 RepID=A0ABW2QLM0_9BURK
MMFFARSSFRQPGWPFSAVLLALTLAVAAVRSPAADAQPAAGPGPKPALTVSVAQPLPASLPNGLQANGNVAAWQEAIVGAEVNGLRLTAVHVNVGDVVKRGQELARFAAETAQAEQLQAQAAVMQAQAAHESAKAEADRARSIQDSGALSASQMAQYLTTERVTHAQWEAAQAQLAAVRLRVAHTRVLAPDDGVVSARAATVGAVVGAGQELFRLLRQGRMEWRAEVTPTEIALIRRGVKAEVTLAGGQTLAGTVRAIAPTADPQTRNILVYVDLPRHEALKANTFARGRFVLPASQALTVPAPAVVLRDGHSYVFVVDAQNKVTPRKVQTGRRVTDVVEVLQGLKADERVAVQGAGFLNEGDLVKVVR